MTQEFPGIPKRVRLVVGEQYVGKLLPRTQVGPGREPTRVRLGGPKSAVFGLSATEHGEGYTKFRIRKGSLSVYALVYALAGQF